MCSNIWVYRVLKFAAMRDILCWLCGRTNVLCIIRRAVGIDGSPVIIGAAIWVLVRREWLFTLKEIRIEGIGEFTAAGHRL